MSLEDLRAMGDEYETLLDLFESWALTAYMVGAEGEPEEFFHGELWPAMRAVLEEQITKRLPQLNAAEAHRAAGAAVFAEALAAPLDLEKKV